jgi:hypothetical protein
MKHLRGFIVLLLMCFSMVIVSIIFDICLKQSFTISGLIVRFISAIGISFLFYIYLHFFVIQKNVSLDISLISWLRWSIFLGAIIFGIGVGTFTLLSMKFIFSLHFSLSVIPFSYTMFILGGFIFGNFIYLCMYIFNRKEKQGV